jgi:hypothetical protein
MPYYLVESADAGSVPCSTPIYKGSENLRALYSCPKSPRHAGFRLARHETLANG